MSPRANYSQFVKLDHWLFGILARNNELAVKLVTNSQLLREVQPESLASLCTCLFTHLFKKGFMEARILHTKFWTDSFTLQLSAIDCYLFLYMFTNSHVNMIGCYELPDSIILSETRCTQKQLDNFKIIIENAGKVFFKNGYVMLRNNDRYNRYLGEKNVIAQQRQISCLDPQIQAWRNTVLERILDTPIHTPIYTPIDTPITYIYNNNNKKGIVKGEKETTIKPNLTDDDLRTIALQKKVSYRVAQSHYELVKDYCLSTGKSYKDYAAAVRNFIQRSLDTGKVSHSQPEKPLIFTERA